MYKGKNNTNHITPSQTSKIDAIVLRLISPYFNKGHTLLMDNYYNSVSLSNTLLKKPTYVTGTLQTNRKGNPKLVIQKKKLKKGEHIFWKRRRFVYVSKLKDKRDVICITTEYQPKIVMSKNKYVQQKLKPLETVKYNEFMSNVDDTDDQLLFL